MTTVAVAMPTAVSPDNAVEPPRRMSLEGVAEATIRFKLAGTRGNVSRACQLRGAIRTLHEVMRPRVGPHVTVEEVTSDDLRLCVRLWRDRDGLSATTVNIRLCVLSLLGLDCKGQWVRVRLPLKWWLPNDKLAVLLAWLRGPGGGRRRQTPFMNSALMADYLEFIAFTGLRVEVKLKLPRFGGRFGA